MNSISHPTCASGARCVIALKGVPAALSPVTRAETRGSRYCIPCYQKKRA